MEALIWADYGAAPADLLVEDDDIILAMVDELSTPTEGRLDAFAPVLANILKNHLGVI
ncbi:hypothetical protein [Pandoraea capi]|uniref:hypothetical protein n=1 Tax=Pandoraea capi TaxID=2508286 RepID=UPI00158390BD|nr:hypothetical protein [Pandoraea capi]